MSQNRIRFADGQLDDVSFALHGCHEHAGQYIEQAPVLALIVCQKLGTHVTYGERDRFAASVSGQPKLRDLLSSYGAAVPLRKIGTSGIRVRHRAAIPHLSKIDASSLAQSVPSDSQGVWLDGICDWLRLSPGSKRAQRKFSVAWIARRLGEDLSRFEQVSALIDFIARGGGELNERWTWQSAMKAVEEWHKSLRDERALLAMAHRQKLAANFDKVICTSSLPDETVIDGLTFRVLRTMRHLREEGTSMHHCVASYAQQVKRGQSTIVSVSRDGVGIATMDINDKGMISQLKGACNQAVTPVTRASCEHYALLHWRAPEDQDTPRQGERRG